MTRMVVDLPAPFGPTKPVTWPGWTVKVMPSSASAVPYRLRSPVTSMVATSGSWRQFYAAARCQPGVAG